MSENNTEPHNISNRSISNESSDHTHNHEHNHNHDHQHEHSHEQGQDHGHSHGGQDPFLNPSKMFIRRYAFRNWVRRRTIYKELIKQFNLQGSETVLDFGSGVGSLAKRIAPRLKKGGQLVCLDVSSPLLDHTRNQLKKYSNIEFLLGGMKSQSLPDQKFDYITATWVLHHLEKDELEQTIAEFSRTLKNGGRIIIIEFSEEFEHSHAFHHMINVSNILALFEKHNFTKKELLNQKAGVMYEFNR